jgi:hypothetical protein
MLRLIVAAAAAVSALFAQQDMSQMSGTHDMSHMSGMNEMPGMSDKKMPMLASGTSMNPASSPEPMVHLKAGGWMFMLHGLAFVADVQQSGPRGADKFLSANWFMVEASHPLGGGTFAARSMLSLEPATIADRRYPELFQTGETAFGRTIIDGQHPHNLFMELSLRYTHPISENSSFTFYVAPVGDPALGPVAFPHRISAAELPQAPLGHHLEDSTHISDEVVTAGVRRGALGIEASGFHGGEPGENRWIIEQGAVDSYSARLTYAPGANWQAQVSAGRLTHPEALEPGDQARVTASVTYNRPYTGGNWASTLLWGRVHKTADGANLNGYLAESVARFRKSNYVTGRIELDDKDELFRDGEPLFGRIFRVGAYTAGYTRDVPLLPRIATGLGANFTTYSMPDALRPYYGQHPIAVWMFVRFRLRE